MSAGTVQFLIKSGVLDIDKEVVMKGSQQHRTALSMRLSIVLVLLLLVSFTMSWPPRQNSLAAVPESLSTLSASPVEEGKARIRETTALVRQGERGVNSGLPVQTETKFGLITTTFDTLEGTVSVNLPDDVAAGDTISGTVIAQPKGTTQDEQAKNEDSLNGYVVEVAKQETPAEQNQGSKWVIPPVAQFIPVVLKNREGKVVAQTEVPFSPGNGSKPNPNGGLQQGNYSTPPFGQAGRPISVAGPFDGDFNNTLIKLGSETAQFLAESPRKVVVRSPANLIGPATIEVNERGRVVARCKYQSIRVRLAADKLNLTRGEQTMLTVTLYGLDGVTSPLPLQLTNASPSTVRMGGGDTQIITANPEYFTGGVFTANRTLTGVREGGFNINAVVDPVMLVQGGGVWKTCGESATSTRRVRSPVRP